MCTSVVPCGSLATPLRQKLQSKLTELTPQDLLYNALFVAKKRAPVCNAKLLVAKSLSM